MKRLILLLAIAISAPIAVAGEGTSYRWDGISSNYWETKCGLRGFFPALDGTAERPCGIPTVTTIQHGIQVTFPDPESPEAKNPSPTALKQPVKFYPEPRQDDRYRK